MKPVKTSEGLGIFDLFLGEFEPLFGISFLIMLLFIDFLINVGSTYGTPLFVCEKDVLILGPDPIF